MPRKRLSTVSATALRTGRAPDAVGCPTDRCGWIYELSCWNVEKYAVAEHWEETTAATTGEGDQYSMVLLASSSSFVALGA